jgi:polyisoprenoid-binding protein YceI
MSLPLTPGTWTLDRSHATVAFTVRHMAISKVRGTFSGVDATLTVGDTMEDSVLSAVVDLSTVNTGNPDRDNHLRGSDFFNVATQPAMTFQSTRIHQNSDGGFVVDGMLTLNGRSNPLTLTVELHGTQTYPMDDSTHAGFSATGSLSRRDYGIDFNVPMATGGLVIGDRVGIELDVQLVAAKSDAEVTG